MISKTHTQNISGDDIENTHKIFTLMIPKTHTQNIYGDDIENSNTEYLR